jgi:predicted DNA-binding WGR domain protein
MSNLVVLDRRDPDRNMAQLYVLSIEQSLFEDVTLVREWGRIGTTGQRKVELHAIKGRAAKAFETWLARKQQRGYRIRSVDSAAVLIMPRPYSRSNACHHPAYKPCRARNRATARTRQVRAASTAQGPQGPSRPGLFAWPHDPVISRLGRASPCFFARSSCCLTEDADHCRPPRGVRSRIRSS